MPTYQYVCTECNEPLEAVQSFSDDPLTECPVCSGRLRKVFSAVGVVFKGSGFYRTDSRAGSSTGSSATGSSNGAKESSSGDSSGNASGGSSGTSSGTSSGGGSAKDSAGSKPTTSSAA